MTRQRISYRASKRLYRRTAQITNIANIKMNFVPRGGVRL